MEKVLTPGKIAQELRRREAETPLCRSNIVHAESSESGPLLRVIQPGDKEASNTFVLFPPGNACATISTLVESLPQDATV